MRLCHQRMYHREEKISGHSDRNKFTCFQVSEARAPASKIGTMTNAPELLGVTVIHMSQQDTSGSPMFVSKLAQFKPPVGVTLRLQKG